MTNDLKILCVEGGGGGGVGKRLKKLDCCSIEEKKLGFVLKFCRIFLMCLALPGLERKLPQGCSFNAEYFYAKTALVMRVSGLVEALEIMSKNFVF